MPTRDEYREKAVECVASAELMLYPAERATLLQVAHRYIMLADYVDRDLDRTGDVGNARQACPPRTRNRFPPASLPSHESERRASAAAGRRGQQ
jgi:hypothetical protein